MGSHHYSNERFERQSWKIAWCHNGVTGGAKRVTYELVGALARRGCLIDEVIIAADPVRDFLPLTPFVRESFEIAFDRAALPELRPFLLDRYTRGALGWWNAQRRETALQEAATRLNRRPYDVVHIDYHPESEAAGLLPYLQRPTVVLTHEASGVRYRGVGSAMGPRPHQDRLLHRWYNYLCEIPARADEQRRRTTEMARLQHASLILANSYYSTETFFQQHGMLAKTCYLGVSTEVFRPLGLSVEPFVLSVGRLVKAKQHHFVIEAVGRIAADRRPRVVLATPEAPQSSQTQAELLQSAMEHHVDVQIVVRPAQDELVRLYNQALAVVFMPIMEPFGLVVLEAMACGTPVIGIREAGVRESIIDGVTGFLVDRDVQQVARAIEHLQRHHDVRLQMGRDGLDDVRRRWTWEHAANRYEEAVSDLLQR